MLRPIQSSLLVLSGVLLVYACSGSESKKAAPYDPSAGSPGDGEAGAAGAGSHTGGSSSGNGGSAGASVAGTGGAATAGAAGEASGGSGGDSGGQTGGAGGEGGNSDAGGAGGSDSNPPTCAETCLTGACVFDTCLGTTTVATSVNLSTTSTSAERQCADAPAFAVTALSASSATIDTAATGCLAADDEVLLINLQGDASAAINVGVWELLKLSGVDGTSVTFTSPKQRRYGSTTDTDDGIGTGLGQQRVALVRVPRFGVLDVAQGSSITANPWDGQLGGVVALRAGRLHLAGKIDGSALGYRPGLFSRDDYDCSDSVQTVAGESIAGTGTPSTLANFGASGGLGAGVGSFNANSPLTATPGHATAGEAGTNYGARAANSPGGVYGTSDASRLTLGSGPGGGLTCDADTHEPMLVPLFLGHAGGIVLVLADEVTLTQTGSISVSPPQSPRDIAFSGGYVLLRGQSLSLGTGQVTALGGVGKGVNGPTANLTNHAGNGYITLDAPAVTGTTTPAATLLQ
jgi:hypothetical protein